MAKANKKQALGRGLSALLKDKAFKQLFLGGIQLEQLYRNKQMKYQLIQFSS